MQYTYSYLATIDESLADESFVEKLLTAEDSTQLKSLFASEKGIEIEDLTAQTAFDKFQAVKNGEELSEEDLEMVAGGCKGCLTYATAGALAGAAVGGVVGAVIGCAIGYSIGMIRFHSGKKK